MNLRPKIKFVGLAQYVHRQTGGIGHLTFGEMAWCTLCLSFREAAFVLQILVNSSFRW